MLNSPIKTPKRLHIVDELIYERAPGLVASIVWPVIKPLLYGLLGYKKAVSMSDAMANLSGEEALLYVSKLLSLKTVAENLDRLPVTGRCVVICNHPTGIADGVAVYDAIRRVRNDAIFFANADALRVSPRLAEVVIPVEWVEAKRTREKTRHTLQAAKDAFEAERCVVLFPAGRLARKGPDGRLSDPSWAPTGITMAQKYRAPLIPIHVSGPEAFWFHSFDKISPELRDITLFHELLNKAGKRFDLRLGPAISPETLDQSALSLDTNKLCEQVKAYIELTLCEDTHKAFDGGLK
jgi:putative hemolysin